MGLLRSVLHIATFGIVDSNEEVARKNTPFRLPDNMNEAEFSNLAIQIAKPIKRFTHIGKKIADVLLTCI